MRQTIIGTQIAFSDPKATHAQKREEMNAFNRYIGSPVKVKDYIWGGRITRLDFSGLSDLLITVKMDGGAEMCFQASDVYINPVDLVFFVGDHSTNPWSVIGVFEVEAAAVRACTTGCHFVGPIELNKAFPEVTDWHHLYYPLQQEMQKEINISEHPTKVRRDALDEVDLKVALAMGIPAHLLSREEYNEKAVSNPTFQGVSVMDLEGQECKTPEGYGVIDQVLSILGSSELRFVVELGDKDVSEIHVMESADIDLLERTDHEKA